MKTLIGPLFGLVLLTACTKPELNNQTEYNSSVISEQEIDASGASTAYDAVKKLRANFLSYRGETSLRNNSSTEPVVYVDGQAFGNVAALKQLSAGQVAEIRLYRSWEATTKFGLGNMAGVIAVITRH